MNDYSKGNHYIIKKGGEVVKSQLTILEFAERTKKHPVTVRRWIKTGVIKAKTDYKGAYIIAVGELKKVNV